MEDSVRLRMRVLGVVAVALFVALFGRLWYLQALQNETFEQVATQQITRSIRTQAERGQIFDRNGRVLVQNRLSTIVTIHRDENKQALINLGYTNLDERKEFRSEMFATLARELSGSGQLTKVSNLQRAFDDPSYTDFEEIPIARDVDEELLIFIGERPDVFPGVRVTQDVVRSYPFGQAAAHILGYVGSINQSELESKEALYKIDDPDSDDPADKIDDPDGKQYRSNDEIGKAGIERFFEDDLRGIPGTRTFLVDNVGNFVAPVGEDVPPRPGSDVHLTIDIDLQVRLEFELKRALDRARDVPVEQDEPPFNAPAGSAVIMDPRNGDILAMASYPTYDPADFIEGLSQDEYDRRFNDPFEHQPLVNRAIEGTYPAASTFKPFTAIAAENFDVFGWDFVEEWNVYTSDPGYWDLQSCKIDFTGDVAGALASGCRKRNAGNQTMEGVDLQHSLTFSSDTYYYKIGEAFWVAPDDQINPNGIQITARDFGYGTTSGVQLPNERPGIMPTAELMRERHEANPDAFPRGQWTSGDNTNISIGQGDVLVTPLQLANSYAVLANGGTLYSPNIVTLIEPNEQSDDEPVEFAPRVVREPDIPDAIEQVILDGLLGVNFMEKPNISQPSGTGFPAFNEPDEGGVDFPLFEWPVAGKTGTAEKVGKADNSMYVGFGPSGSAYWSTPENEPEYVISVVLEEAGFGSKVAAPMVARMFKAIAEDDIDRAISQEEADDFYALTQSLELEAPDSTAAVDQ